MFFANPSIMEPYVSDSDICPFFHPSASVSTEWWFGANTNSQRNDGIAANDYYYYVAKTNEPDGADHFYCSPFVHPFIMIRHNSIPGSAFAIYQPSYGEFTAGECVWDRLYCRGLDDGIYDNALAQDENWQKTPVAVQTAIKQNVFNSGQIKMCLDFNEGVFNLSWVPTKGTFPLLGNFQFPWDTAEYKNSPEVWESLSGMSSSTRVRDWTPPYEVWRGFDDCRMFFTVRGDPPKFGQTLEAASTAWKKMDNGGFARSFPTALNFSMSFFYPYMGFSAGRQMRTTGEFRVLETTDGYPGFYDEIGTHSLLNYRGQTLNSTQKEIILKNRQVKHFGQPVWRISFSDFEDGDPMPNLMDIPGVKEKTTDEKGEWLEEIGNPSGRVGLYMTFIRDRDYFSLATASTTSKEFKFLTKRDWLNERRSSAKPEGQPCAMFFVGMMHQGSLVALATVSRFSASLEQVGSNSRWEYGNMHMTVNGRDHVGARPHRGESTTLTNTDAPGTVTVQWVTNCEYPITFFNPRHYASKVTAFDTDIIGGACAGVGNFSIGLVKEGHT